MNQRTQFFILFNEILCFEENFALIGYLKVGDKVLRNLSKTENSEDKLREKITIVDCII